MNPLTLFFPRGWNIGRSLAGVGVAACSAGVFATVCVAAPQLPTSFSIDGHGPTIGVPDPFSGVPITAGDILTIGTMPPPPGTINLPAGGPLGPPAIVISGGFGPPAPGLGIPTHGACVGVPPGALCPIEVDALSYGTDHAFQAGPSIAPGSYQFSVDEWAVGSPGPLAVVNVVSEGATGTLGAAADIFGDLGSPSAGPNPPFATPLVGSRMLVDGDGLVGVAPFPFGLGLVQPTLPVPPPNPGDNLDAVDVNQLFWSYPVYYSLDAAFPDPFTGFPNAGTAIVSGVSGAEVVMTPVAGAPPLLWAPGPLLGLDLMGFDSDDLDALALWENGTGVFEPAPAPFAWSNGSADMLLFSVRVGSAVIGMPDSLFGLPIEAGDILSTPVIGGASPFPSIFVAAENLGLWTARSNGPHPMTGLPFGDDLDALDTVNQGPLADCNSNGVDDSFDILLGTSSDNNGNGIPDECEVLGTNYCGPATLNSSGAPAVMSANGVALPQGPLILRAGQLPANQFGYFLGSRTTGFFMPAASQGFLCLGGNIARFNAQVQNSGGAGTMSIQVNTTAIPTNPPAPILSGQSWNFQCWFRDLNPASTSNFSDGLTIQY